MKKLIWISSLSYLLIGLAHVVIGSLLPVLLEHYGRNYSDGGRLIFSQFAGFLIGVLCAPLINRRFGKRGGIMTASLLLLVAEFLFIFLPPWGWMYVIGVMAGFGFGMIEAVIGTVIIASITERTAVAMSRIEVLFGAGALLMPLIAGWLIQAGAWKLSFAVIAGFSAVTILLWGKLSFGSRLDGILSRTPPSMEHPAGGSAGQQRYTRKAIPVLALFIVFFFLYVGTEMSLVNFLPSMLIEKWRVSESDAALSVTFFWLAMTGGRLIAGFLAEKIGYRSYVLVGCAGAMILLALFPLVGKVWGAFALILLIGFFMSGLFSIALVFASRMLPGTEESTPSLLIAAGGVGGALLPLLTGWSMDHMSVDQSAGLLAASAAALTALGTAAYALQGRLQRAR